MPNSDTICHFLDCDFDLKFRKKMHNKKTGKYPSILITQIFANCKIVFKKNTF